MSSHTPGPRQTAHEELRSLAAYAYGQLQGCNAAHRIEREYPEATRWLPADEVRRGRHDAQDWLKRRATALVSGRVGRGARAKRYPNNLQKAAQ